MMHDVNKYTTRWSTTTPSKVAIVKVYTDTSFLLFMIGESTQPVLQQILVAYSLIPLLCTSIDVGTFNNSEI